FRRVLFRSTCPMATDMALRMTRSALPRQLWQAPAFLLGAAVLAAVPLTRSHWHKNDEAGLARQLAQARQALAQMPPDTAQALQRAFKVLESADRYPQLAAEAHFLVGSARLRQIDPAAPDAAALAQVRDHLEQAEKLGVPESDRPKLTYRLGKTGFWLGANPAQAASNLAQSVKSADDPAEGY